MNKQEAIDLLVSCTTFDCEHCNKCYRGCEDKDKFEEMKAVAISALEKQTPKKVIRVNIPPKWGGKIIKCPSCDSKNIGTKFCLDCGQALDWSGEDE